MSEQLTIDTGLVQLDINQIQKLIPHRYPFLLIDRAVNIVEGKSIVGIKNVTFNEPYFVGHFPNHPVMPGVLIVEAMAQSAATLVVHTMGEEAHGKVVYFMSVEEAKFRRPVVPGDVLAIHCEAVRSRGNVWKFEGIARVNGVKVAEATYSAMIMDEKGA
jgi:3-hydroxyacyl-[acyl-carrier-protein] dehydratase